MQNKKKKATAAAAIATAAALLLGGTFAWQSISQTALNEKEETINPGGRLHDDFDGSNKDVYVENFASDPIYARVRLDEYFEFTSNKGTDVEETHIIAGADKGDTSTYATHIFDGNDATDAYWTWTTGGSTVYMPTFNKNKDSLAADINGTFANNYEDYVAYTDGETLEAEATYDNDSNNVEDDGIITNTETHAATTTLDGTLISMQNWIDLGSQPGPYWVYDTDGWVYWADAIQPGEATGLLLNGITPVNKFDDSYYYAINVTGQFITADDAGKDDGTGFYDTMEGAAPSADAEDLLRAIGVDMGEKYQIPEGDTIYAAFTTRNDGHYDLVYFTSADDLTNEQKAKSAGTTEDKLAACFTMPTSNDEHQMSFKLYGWTDDYITNAATVRFANLVQPKYPNAYFQDLGENLDVPATINWRNFDTSLATNLRAMFYSANIAELDLSTFDTSNVTDMSRIFMGSEALTSVKFGNNFDTSKVTNMMSVFYGCSSLEEIDISMFDTSDVTNMSYMFYSNSSLNTIHFGDGWNTSNVTDMSIMFANCVNLTLDCSDWDVSACTSHTSFRVTEHNVDDTPIDTIIEPAW